MRVGKTPETQSIPKRKLSTNTREAFSDILEYCALLDLSSTRRKLPLGAPSE